MRIFLNLPTSVKLVAGFVVTGLITVAVGWLGIVYVGAMNANTEDIYQKQLLACVDLAVMRGLTWQTLAKTNHAVAVKDIDAVKADIIEVREMVRRLEQKWGEAAPSLATTEIRAAFDAYRDASRLYFARRDETVFQPLLAGNRDGALEALQPLTPFLDDCIKKLNATIEIRTEFARERFEESQRFFATSRSIMASFAFGGMVLAVGIGYGISRTITQPLRALVGVLECVAKGDMQRKMVLQRADEFGRVAIALNTAIDSLRKAADFAKQANTEGAAVNKLMMAVANTREPDDAVRAALETVRGAFGWTYGSYWKVDSNENVLKFAIESGSITEEFRRLSSEARFREGEGLNGRAWRSRELFYADDLAHLSDCPRGPAAQRAGIRLGVCFPISVSGKIVGTMDFFATDAMSLTPERAEVLRGIGRIVSAAIERVTRETEMALVQSMTDQNPVGVVFAGLDYKIRYINRASERILKELEKYLPVRADNVVGQYVDAFHKNPEMQRRLLSDPRNLPHHGMLAVGPEMIEFTVSAVLDHNKKYAGGMLTWEIATKKLQLEREIKESVEREKKAADELRTKVDAMLQVVSAAAQGDLTREVVAEGDGAVDQLAQSLNGFFQDLRGNMAKLSQTATSLSGSAEELSSVSQQMGGNARETSAQAGVVSAASEQVSASVQTVATGIEEMSASIKEISKNASDAARVANEAVGVANSANATVSKLGESSAEIGQVIKVITSIAQQTNLLALNATIEAARAGEAGKGFAVVANEVKELAKETARATEEIGQKIEAIQDDTKGAVDAIAKIGGIIARINDISNTIASAVEEQTATTNEIGRSVGEVAKSSADIAQNITSVAGAAESTTKGAGNTQSAAVELARMATELQQLVGRFKLEGRQASPAPVAPSRVATLQLANGHGKIGVGR